MEIFEENISGLRNPFFPLKYLWLVERMVDMANNNDLHVHILVARFGLCLNFIATFDFLVFFLVNQIWVWLHLPFLTLAYLCRKASIWLCLIAIQFNSGFRTSPPMHWWRCPESWIRGDKILYKHASFLRGASLILGDQKRPKDVAFYDFPKMDLDSQSPGEIYTFGKFTIISRAAIKD